MYPESGYTQTFLDTPAVICDQASALTKLLYFSKDIKDINGDDEALYSKLTINDIFGYPLDATKGVDIRHAKVKPGIYTGEELVPELVYKGETLEPGVDYIWTKEATEYDDNWDPITEPFIEPGDYYINLMGKKTYKISSAKKDKKSFRKYFRINKSTGKVTISKKLKKGTYRLKIKVKAKGDSNYKASAERTVTVRVKVK